MSNTTPAEIARDLHLDHGTVQIFTYRFGVLARVGHDLRLRIERFSVRLAGNELTARFWPDSLRVDGAVQHGRLVPNVLSAADIADILERTRRDVLQTKRFAQIVYTATVPGASRAALLGQPSGPPRVGQNPLLTGTLSLCGHSERLDIAVQRRGAHFVGTVDLHPSRWGIAPYRALLGALRVRDLVRVSFALQDTDLRAVGEDAGA